MPVLAREVVRLLEGALYGMDELIRSYTITHVVRGQCKGQPRLTADDMSAASEAEHQYQDARRAIEEAIRKAKAGNDR